MHAPFSQHVHRAAAALVGIVLAVNGCYAGLATDNVDHERGVGVAPLRRLSDREYVHTLADLFPDVPPYTVELPREVAVAGFDNAAEAQVASDVRIARYEAIATHYAHAAVGGATLQQAIESCVNHASAPEDCALDHLYSIAARLFRRPVDDATRVHYARKFHGWTVATDLAGAVELSLSSMLQSSQFLYRIEHAVEGAQTAVDDYDMASRLSYFLWESTPDAELLASAERHELRTDEQIRRAALRMLGDQKVRRSLWGFLGQWLGLGRIEDSEHAVRTASVDAAWTSRTQASALQESKRFAESFADEQSRLADVFLSRHAWVDSEMARVYGLSEQIDEGSWKHVQLPESERAGMLTRAAFLAGQSHRGGTSPPIRGNSVLLHTLCVPPSSPPPNADLSMPTLQPGEGPRTNRQLFEQRTQGSSCAGCHQSLNGVGFGFEQYSASGAFQLVQNGLPIDASGELFASDRNGPYDGAIELSERLSQSRVVHDCASKQWLRYALGRAPLMSEQAYVTELAEKFFQSGGDIRTLLLGIVTSPSFRAPTERGP